MRVVTRKQNAARIASTYYPDDGRDHPPWWFAKRDKLRALGDDPDPDEVDQIIDRLGATWFDCSVCEGRTDVVVEFDYDPGEWQGYVIHICRACVGSATKLLGGVS